MSELKATTVYDAYWKANSTGEGTDVLVYLKYEADKVIAELEKKLDLYKRGWEESDKNNAYLYAQLRYHKYKRCLAMAKWCESEVYNIMRTPLCDMDEHEGWRHDDEFWQRWQNRWLELSEKFKEVK